MVNISIASCIVHFLLLPGEELLAEDVGCETGGGGGIAHGGGMFPPNGGGGMGMFIGGGGTICDIRLGGGGGWLLGICWGGIFGGPGGPP